MYIAADIGGTKTLVAVFDDGRNIISQIKFETPKDVTQFKGALENAKNELSISDTPISGAIGTRGVVNRQAGVLVYDDILGWRDAPLVDIFSSTFGCSFSVENDSKLAGLSEAIGSGSQYKKVLYFTISTGVGSAFVVDGKLDQNTIDSEVGKWVFEHNGKLQAWEDFASGKSIVEEYGKLASELDDPEAWKSICANMALGIVNACGAYTPDLVILGGGVGTHFDKYAGALDEAIKAIVPEAITVPKIIKAQHPEEAVVYGSFELAKQNA